MDGPTDASADTAALIPLMDQTPETTDEEDPNRRRIIVLGKTGAGKSSTCSTIFGEAVFKINHSANSGTSECVAKTRSVNGKSITLIDTPGFFDTDKSEEELKPELVECIIECAPGPHAFLILLKVEKFTEQEKQVIDEIRNTFSEEAFKYAVVVFTHGDQLPEGEKIEDFVKQNKDLSDLVKKCGGRCHVIDNKYWKNNQQDEYRSNQFQVEQLLNTIDKMVMENKGGYYTNEMLQEVERMIRKHGKSKVYNFLKMSAGIITGALLGALLGVPAMIVLTVIALKEMPTLVVKVVEALGTAGAMGVVGGGAAAGAAAGAVGGAAAAEVAAGGAVGGAAAAEVAAGGAVGGAAGIGAGTGIGIVAGVAVAVGAGVGGYIGYHEADKAESAKEAAQNTVKAICDKAIETLNKLKIKEKQQQSDEKSLLRKQL